MTWGEIIGFSFAMLVMFVGVIGSVLPVLPGAPIVLMAAIVHRLYFGNASIGNWGLVILLLLTAMSFIADYVATAKGAKKFGATWRGAVGAMIGMVVGIFFGLPGILLGPFMGALAFEMIGGYKFRKAADAGLGATIGLLFGALAKFVICLVMMVLFAASVLYSSFNR